MALLFYNSYRIRHDCTHYRIRHDCTHSHVQRTTDLGSDLRSGSVSNAVEEVIVEGGRLCAARKTRCGESTNKKNKKKKKKRSLTSPSAWGKEVAGPAPTSPLRHSVPH